MVLLMALGSAAGAQAPTGGSEVSRWLQRVEKPSIVIESVSEQWARLSVRGHGREQLVIEAPNFTVSTTSLGLKVVSDGTASLSWANGTDRMTVEVMELTFERQGGGTLRANRITATR
jgi:uncharacterized protein YfaP (DUF2135 family)